MKQVLFLLFFPGFLIQNLAYSQRRSLKPEIILFPQSTTLIANGKDSTLVRVQIMSPEGKILDQSQNDLHISLIGKGSLKNSPLNQNPLDNTQEMDIKLIQGKAFFYVHTLKDYGIIQVRAYGDSLYSASTEIHTLWPGNPHPLIYNLEIPGKSLNLTKTLGADISFLPQLEFQGMKFYNTQGQVSDALDILKENGFNYIRLRIFHDPKSDSAAYSPLYGFCDLENTLKMAKRVKKSGMKFLLDFHYSDTWADPQKQFTPRAWSSLDYATLKDSVFRYTLNVMRALKNQGTEPDMVQIGNEINHGILWPDGAINNLDSLAGLLYAGIKASKEVNPSVLVMLHIALGGQNEESRFFLDQMALRKVPFDILGLSYYPKWHGSPSDLRNNIRDLSRRYSKPIIIAEYSALKKEVNEIAFTAAGKKSLGSFIWEPLNTWEFIFNRNGKPNDKMNIYPVLAKKYLRP